MSEDTRLGCVLHAFVRAYACEKMEERSGGERLRRKKRLRGKRLTQSFSGPRDGGFLVISSLNGKGRGFLHVLVLPIFQSPPKKSTSVRKQKQRKTLCEIGVTQAHE